MASTYAIISVGGKQYRVREGERLVVDRLKTEEGKTFHPDVLFLGGDGEGTLAPRSQVTAKVVGHVLGDKVRIGKRRAKTGYRKQTGFRAHLSQIEIQSIGGAARRTATMEGTATGEAAKPKETPQAAPKDSAVSQPPRGYENLTVAEISERAKRWKTEGLEAALEYEHTNANRKGAIAALQSALDAKQDKE